MNPKTKKDTLKDITKGDGPLSDQLYRLISRKIITWQIRSEEILVEERLAEEYNVSKTPVREALALLRQDGLVEVLPRIGYRVVPVSIQDIHDVFDLRILLEGDAAFLVAVHPPREKLQALLEEERVSAALLAAEGGSKEEYLEFHDTFHLGIARMCGNVRLARFVEQLLREGARLRMANPFTLKNEGIKEAQEDSEQIVGQMLDHNAEEARRLLQEHIIKSRERILSEIVSRGSKFHVVSHSTTSLDDLVRDIGE